MKNAWLTLLLCLPAPAAAASGLTGAPVLNTPIGARSSGLGRAFTAVPGDPEAVNYNPAALAFAGKTRISATYMSGYLDGGYGLLSVPVPLGPVVLTPAFMFFNSGKMDLNLSDGTRATVTAESDRVAYLSAAWRPLPRLGLGATLKRASLELAEAASASSVHYDLGVLYSAANGFSFGAALLNSGQDIKFEDSGDPPPVTRRAGASYRFNVTPPNLFDPGADIVESDMLLTADWSRTDKEKGYYQGGAEANMTLDGGVVFTVRLGYLAGRDSAGTSYGLGVAGSDLGLDCSFVPSDSLDTVSQATLTYKF